MVVSLIHSVVFGPILLNQLPRIVSVFELCIFGDIDAPEKLKNTVHCFLAIGLETTLNKSKIIESGIVKFSREIGIQNVFDTLRFHIG